MAFLPEKGKMKEKQVRSDVLDLIEEQFFFPKEKIKDDLGPGDLPRWDSIGHMQLVQKLERHFNISFSVFDIMELDTIKDIRSTVLRLLEDRK